MEIKIKKSIVEFNNSVCFLSQDIFDALGLSEKLQYNIHAGQLYQASYLVPAKGSSGQMLVCQNVSHKLSLPEDLILNIRREATDIYLGPVVGVFINDYMFQYYKDKPLCTSRDHVKAAIAEKCFCYYFPKDDINWADKKIKGYTLSPVSNEWISDWYPMPDIIYDRGVRFDKEEKPLVKEIREKFRAIPSIKIINCKEYLDKWGTYQKLSKYPEICRYLPETIIYNSFNDVIIKLKQYGFIFLKSFYGSGGKQVLSLEQVEDKYILVFYEDELKELFLYDIDEVRKLVESFTKEKKFVIQKGIRLLKYNDRVFDMRILIIKNKKGKWRSISNCARIAKQNLTITNYSAGGDLEYYENIYPYLRIPDKTKKIPEEKKIEEVTIKIAEHIEKAYGSFGEIGMDMALDIYGKLWFIEANTKPDKERDVGFDDFIEMHPQYLAIFEYSKYLTDF